MKEFIITLLFGWLGVHKFIQKKYGLGILYFFTLGLFGIGWLIDTVMAFMRMTTGKQPEPEIEEENVFSGGGIRASGKQLIKSFDTVIVGTFATCDLDPDANTDREEIISSFKPNSFLYLQHWVYEGEPAYYVCCQGMDAGNIPATLAKTLYEKYSDCEFVVTLQGKAIYDNRNNLTQKIKIDVYK